MRPRRIVDDSSVTQRFKHLHTHKQTSTHQSSTCSTTNTLSEGLMNPSKFGSLKRELLFAFLPTLESRRPKAVRISIEFPSQQMQQTLVSVLDADRLKSLPFKPLRFFGWHDFHTNWRPACLKSSSTLPSTRQLEEVLENPNQWPASYATLIAKL